MKLILGYAASALVGAMVLAHTLQDASAEPPQGSVIVHTPEGAVVEPISAAPAATRSDVARVAGLSSQASAFAARSFYIRPDVGEGHAARDAVRAEAEPALNRLLTAATCDGVARQAYLEAVGPYVALRLQQMKEQPVSGVDPRWHTPEDAAIVSGFDTLLRRGLLSQGDMQRAVLTASWQGRVLLLFKPTPREAEWRSACVTPAA